MDTTQQNAMTTANTKTGTFDVSLQARNIARVQALVAEYQKGNPEGYLAGVADNFKGSVLGGVIPGGDKITSKADFVAMMPRMEEYIEVKKFEPCNWRAVGDDVLFNVNWVMVWKATGKEVETTALVRKVLKDGMICEKYHCVDVEAITGVAQPEAKEVKRVKELLAHYQAGNPEGYLAGVSDDFKGSILGGLIPGADNLASKADFMAMMPKMEQYMEVRKFEPCNFRGMPNNDMMFNVDWTFVWKPTGKVVDATAVVRKVLNAEGCICEKYHMVDVADVTSPKESPREVTSNQVA